MTKRHGYLKTAAEQAIAERRLAAGVISERYPQVEALTMGITYYRGPQNSVVMVRTINFFPTSDAYFDMPCLIKDCTNGGFDLTKTVDELIKSGRKSKCGKMPCRGKDPSHASIAYEITVQYKKKR